MRPKKPRVDQMLELQQARQPELVLHHAVLHPRRPGFPIQGQGLGQIRGGGLLRVDMLPGGDGAANTGNALIGQGGVEVDRVAAVGQGAVQIRRVLLDPVLLGQGTELVDVAAHQDRFRHDDLVRAQFNPALFADRQDGAKQVLVGPHASRDAVHDDADGVRFHWFASAWPLGLVLAKPYSRDDAEQAALGRRPVHVRLQGRRAAVQCVPTRSVGTS